MENWYLIQNQSKLRAIFPKPRIEKHNQSKMCSSEQNFEEYNFAMRAKQISNKQALKASQLQFKL